MAQTINTYQLACMTTERYNQLMDDEKSELTKEEWDQGWHFCMSEWDGLLIGPGMPEFKYCNCAPKEESEGPVA